MSKKITLVLCGITLMLIVVLINIFSVKKKDVQLLPNAGISFVKVSYTANDVYNGKIREWPGENIVDNNMTSHWCTADHVGEWAFISLKKDYSLSKIGFVNGNGSWHRPNHREAYFKDGRVKKIRIELSNGWKKTIQLKDHGDLQFFDLGKQKSDYVKVTVQSLYPMGEWSHVCLSEVQVFAEESPQEKKSSSVDINENQKNIKNAAVLKTIHELSTKIEANPNNVNNHIALGKIFLKLNLNLDALKEFKTAVALDSTNGKLYYLKALVHMRLGERTDGLDSISKSLNIFISKGEKEEFKNAFVLLKKLKEETKLQDWINRTAKK